MAKIEGINIPKSEHDKNYIINGDMRIAQRGTSFPAIAGSTYSLDRWTNINNTSAVFTITQDTDVPTAGQAGYLFQNSLKVDVTTADASVAAGDRVQIRQIIEGYNWANIAQKKFTVSFWVKATKTGTYCISLVNNGSDRSYVAEYTINSTLTWEYKTITILASPSAGGWNYTNSVGIVLSWTLMAGTNFNTTPGAWQTGNLHSTSNQVNSLDSTSNDFWLTGVMVNEGVIAAPFKLFGEDIEGELAACLRYYERLGENFMICQRQYAGAIASYRLSGTWRATKRAAPTSAIVGTWAVINSGQPVVDGSTATGWLLINSVPAVGIYEYLTDSVNDYLEASAEL